MAVLCSAGHEGGTTDKRSRNALSAAVEGLAKRVGGSGWLTWRVTLATVTDVLMERRLEDSE